MPVVVVGGQEQVETQGLGTPEAGQIWTGSQNFHSLVLLLLGVLG